MRRHRKKFYQRFFGFLKKPYLGYVLGLVLALTFSAVVYVYATPPASPYNPGDTLNPNCAPGDANCTVTAPLSGSSTQGYIPFYSASSSVVTSTISFFWNNTNKRLGIGTSTPNNLIQIPGLINFDDVDSNIGLGSSTLANKVAGSAIFNTCVGIQACQFMTTGNYNAAFGENALNSNTTGVDNMAIGPEALFNNTTGLENAAVGTNSLYANTTGGTNTSIGNYAMQNNTTGSSSVAIGYQALNGNNTGSSSVAVGFKAMFANTTGFSDVALGFQALNANSSGKLNTGGGFNALFYNRTGSANSVFGYQAGYGVSTKSFSSSTLLGYQSGYSLGTSNANILLGYQAGYSLITGSNNIVLGYNTDVASTTTTSTLDIANLIYATNLSNFGSPTTTISTGNIGFGTTTPATLFQVVGTSTLRVILPESDNTYSLGASGIRWSNLFAATSTVGDLVFGNDFRFTEATSTDLLQELLLKNQRGEEILKIDELGNLTVGGVINGLVGRIKGALAELGLYIQDGIAKVSELITDKITTKELCLENVCVNKDQLKTLLEKNQLPTESSAPNSEPAIAAPESAGEQANETISNPTSGTGR